MKKCLNISFVYAIASLASGVFFREFTKLNDFDGVTALGKVHPHLFLLGAALFLVLGLFCTQFKSLPEKKLFRSFLCVYNIGVAATAALMAVRGVFEVLGTELSKGANGAISGIAGLAHMTVAAGIIMMFIALKSAAKTEEYA